MNENPRCVWIRVIYWREKGAKEKRAVKRHKLNYITHKVTHGTFSLHNGNWNLTEETGLSFSAGLKFKSFWKFSRAFIKNCVIKIFFTKLFFLDKNFWKYFRIKFNEIAVNFMNKRRWIWMRFVPLSTIFNWIMDDGLLIYRRWTNVLCALLPHFSFSLLVSLTHYLYNPW